MKKIPIDLDEAISKLSEMLSDKDKEYFKKAKDLCIYHHTLGRWIRNEWKLWEKGSTLLKWFEEKGLTHPDDISSVILDATQAKINGEEYDLNIAIGLFKRYWEAEKSKKY